MPHCRKLALLAALLFAAAATPVHADKKTVCTITVNSADEREVFRRYLPAEEFDFVELVERGRPDWLASSCRAGVRCDVLMISGHFDGGTEFYSDRLDAREFLPVAELERASCSASCPGLFSQLKEVYLFGCGTLDPEATRSTTAEVTRSLLRSGHSVADAQRLAQLLNERHGESNREQMRRIFKDVPTIYGFSGKAPLGRYAGPLLERYLVETGTAEVASGRPSAKLLALFAPTSMTVTSGASDADAGASHRDDVCRFADDRLTPAQRAEFVHQLLGREMAEVRMHLDRIERYAAALSVEERESPAVSVALDAIARDEAARLRYLEFARDADAPAVRARMMDLARNLGWLTPADQRAEFIRMVGERIAANTIGVAEVDLVCSLNKDGALSAELPQLRPTPAQAGRVANAAVLACLGSASGHARVLRALTSPNDDDVQMAEIYLRHRPIGDATELKMAASGVARMPASDAQVRALETLSRHSLSDRESLQELTRAFVQAKSVRVQRAVAGVLLRSDYRAIGDADLARALRQYRLKSPDGEDVIDILIRRLQSS
jgi:hypothetical protein